MESNAEGFNNTVPDSLTTKRFDYRSRLYVPRLAADVFLYLCSELFNSFAHAPIISTRSRTVQKLFVTALAQFAERIISSASASATT
jgi:hypothetical protein